MKKQPEERAGSSGSLVHREAVIVIFQTMDELRIWAPVALREWLKRNRPQGRQLLRTGRVLEWGAHQETLSNSSVSEGGGS